MFHGLRPCRQPPLWVSDAWVLYCLATFFRWWVDSVDRWKECALHMNIGINWVQRWAVVKNRLKFIVWNMVLVYKMWHVQCRHLFVFFCECYEISYRNWSKNLSKFDQTWSWIGPKLVVVALLEGSSGQLGAKLAHLGAKLAHLGPKTPLNRSHVVPSWPHVGPP